MRAFTDLVAGQVAADVRSLPEMVRTRMSGRARLERCISISDLRRQARRRLPRPVFDFVDGGSNAELTLGRNEVDFEGLSIFPSVLAGASDPDLSTTVCGVPVSLPILGAPTGLTGLVHPDGEVAVARGVHGAGSLYVVAAMASYSVEELAERAPGPTWLQVYVWRDRSFVVELLERAKAVGFSGLVVTVDVPTAATRERDERSGFSVPPRVNLRTLAQGATHPIWASNFLRNPRINAANAEGRLSDRSTSLAEYVNGLFDPGLSWSDLEWLRSAWEGPLVVKGILRADDARRAVRVGADAIVVSNHGGRQLDGAPSTITALPTIADAVGGDAEVYLDSGVRRGSDVLKALALGARACLVARPLIYGLASGGEAGTSRAMDLLGRELRIAMTLAGRHSVADLGPDIFVGSALQTSR